MTLGHFSVGWDADDEGNDFSNVARVLGREDRRMPKQFLALINREAKGLVREAKRKVKAIPTEGDEHTGLRREIAAGLFIEPYSHQKRDDPVPAVGVNIGTRTAEEDEAVIPLGFDARRGWRHPVFGDKTNWVTQHNPGGYSWFVRTMRDGKDDIGRGIHRIVDDSKDDIADAGHL